MQTQAERMGLARTLFARATAGRTQPIKVRVIYGNSDLVRNALIAIASMWKEAFGIEVDVYSEEFRVFLETQKDPDQWQIVRMAWVADYNDPLTFLETFRSGNAANVYGYRNSRFDALLDSSQHTVEPLARLALLEQAERMLLDDVAFIPLFHMQSRRLVSPRVNGFQVTPLNRIYSRHLSLDD
jgi:oligopeptide transport system substrate-binding protein